MKVISILLLLALATTALARWKKPDFCGKMECPKYEVEDECDAYEVRTYREGFWVETSVKGNKYELAYTKASARLLKYFKGQNEDEIEMEYTTPMLAALNISKSSEQTERLYNFSMWLDEKDYSSSCNKKEGPPEPQSDEVRVKRYPEITVFVKTFGGFATEATILQQTTALHEELVSDEEDFHKDAVYVAVYDPAIKLLNRHNEVHVQKKSKKEPSLPSFW